MTIVLGTAEAASGSGDRATCAAGEASNSEAERGGGGAAGGSQAGPPQAEGGAAPPGGHRKGARVAVLQATRSDAVDLEESERSLGASRRPAAPPLFISRTGS